MVRTTQMCAEESCSYSASHTIDNVKIDGHMYRIPVCTEHYGPADTDCED